jgi:excisionase family DNA binding protein
MSSIPTVPHEERQLVFTSSQAARYLGVSLATVRRWTDAGFLTGYRTPGGQRRFSREQLDGFVASLQRTDQRRAHDSQTEPATDAGHAGHIRRVA